MHASHPLDAGDFVEQQILVSIHVTDDNLQLVIRLLAGDQQALQHFRNLRDRRFEVGEALRRMLVHRNANQRHQGQAKFFGIKPGTITRNNSGLFQRTHPAQTG